MNLRTTPLLFGVLLGILWLFGLVLVYKKGVVDEAFILPSMQGPDVKVNEVKIEYKAKDKDKDKGGAEQLVFVRENDLWYVLQSGLKIRVENFRIDDMIREITSSKRYEEEHIQNDTGGYGLPPGTTPRMAVTLKGKVGERNKEWKFYVGNTGAGEFTVYVNSSDRSGRAYPVQRAALENLFFKDIADLRSKRLFDTIESLVTYVDVKEGKEELALKKVENTWRFEVPALGFAGFESTGAAPDDTLKKDKGKETSGVKALIGAITGIHVDSEKDFEPIGVKPLADYGLKEGEEHMRIVLGSGDDKPAKKDEKAKKDEGKREILLIGRRVAQAAGKKTEAQVYARMKGDDGVFRISAKLLDPIKEAVADPKRIRSKDVAAYEAKKMDAVVVTTHVPSKDAKGKETTVKSEFKLLHPPDKDWQVVVKDEKMRKGNEKAILALIEALEGKNEITEFADNKDDSWGGLNGPNTSELSVYIDALEKEKEKKKEEKQADKKTGKKDEKKEEKQTAAELKKDAKPFVKIIIGTVAKTQKVAYIKRVLQDGTVSRFTVPLAYVEKLRLEDGALAYIDTALPSQSLSDVVAVDLQRGKDKIGLDRLSDMIDRWALTDVHDPLGGKLADADKVRSMIRNLTTLTARKWVKKDDPEKLGLKEPSLTVTLHTRKTDRVEAIEAASVVGMLAPRSGYFTLPPLGLTVVHRLGPPVGEQTTISFGKEIDEKGEKLVYAEQSGVDLAFLVPAALVKSIRDVDLRDRSGVKYTQAKVGATLLGLAIGSPLIIGSPLDTAVINGFDPEQVKEINITLRTRVELRSFTFGRVDKTWVDQSGTKEFTLDTDKVTQLLDKVCKLRTERFASFGGPTGDSKLTPDEATLQIELKFKDKTRVTLTIGAQFEQLGYFANSSAWRDAVFFVPASMIDPWLQGVTYFGKERAAGL